jgi:hypothetical protein
MGEQGLLSGYVGPTVVDYGNLVEMTAAVHLLMGAGDTSDLSFSSPLTPSGGGEPGGVAEGSSDPTGTAGSLASNDGGASGGGTSGGGGSHGGGQLPFTGLAAGAVAAIGSALAAGGGTLRRAVRSRRP